MFPDQAEVDRLLADPRFETALLRFCTELPQRYAHDWRSSRALVEARRYGLAVMIAHRGIDQNSRPLATMELVTLCEQGGLARRRAVEGALDTLVAAGFVHQGSADDDRRTRLLHPTDRLLGHLRGSLARRLDFLSTLYCLPAPPDALASRPGSLAAALKAEVDLFLQHGTKLHDDSPAVRFFTERLGGFFLMLELLGRAARVPAGTPFPVELQAVAHRLCVSRTHVAKLLAAAADAGLIAREPGSATAIRLVAQVDLRRAIAVEFAWTARHQRLTPFAAPC